MNTRLFPGGCGPATSHGARGWGNLVSPDPCAKTAPSPSRGRGRGETGFPLAPARRKVLLERAPGARDSGPHPRGATPSHTRPIRQGRKDLPGSGCALAVYARVAVGAMRPPGGAKQPGCPGTRPSGLRYGRSRQRCATHAYGTAGVMTVTSGAGRPSDPRIATRRNQNQGSSPAGRSLATSSTFIPR